MAENAEKTAAVAIEKLANAYAQGKTTTVVSGKDAFASHGGHRSTMKMAAALSSAVAIGKRWRRTPRRLPR